MPLAAARARTTRKPSVDRAVDRALVGPSCAGSKGVRAMALTPLARTLPRLKTPRAFQTLLRTASLPCLGSRHNQRRGPDTCADSFRRSRAPGTSTRLRRCLSTQGWSRMFGQVEDLFTRLPRGKLARFDKGALDNNPKLFLQCRLQSVHGIPELRDRLRCHSS